MLTAIWRKRRSPSRREPKTGAMQRQHAWKRLLQRFGIAVHLTQLDQMVEDIQAGKYRLLQRQSRRVSVFAVTVEGHDIAAVYDRERHAVITFLPLQWVNGEPQIDESELIVPVEVY
jgi:hypothetical protein